MECTRLYGKNGNLEVQKCSDSDVRSKGCRDVSLSSKVYRVLGLRISTARC